MKPARISMQTLTDMVDPARAAALQAALGLKPDIAGGSPLPPFFHHLYFWQAEPPERLGRDGHPKVGKGLIPDLGLPRRMWAGGRLDFAAPLIAGETAHRETVVEQAQHKVGKSGELGFVTLRHELRQGDRLCLTEWQDLVYREEADPAAARPVPPQAPVDEEEAREASFDTTLLFRYSALTFNGHRIHYDLAYAREVEGYDGLVVHGPLLAQLLMLMAREALGELAGFSFRATAPLIAGETATLCRKGTALWVRGPDGRQCMQATATPSE